MYSAPSTNVTENNISQQEESTEDYTLKSLPIIEKKDNEELFLYINDGPELWKWSVKTNSRLFELFEWIDDSENKSLTLHYKSLWYKGMNIAPEIKSYDGKRFFVNNDESIASFKSSICGYANIKAPREGMVNILVNHGTLTIRAQEIPDNTDILTLDYSEDTISGYKEQKRQEIELKKQKEEERAKKEVKEKLIAKQKKRELEKIATQELIDEGILFPDANKRPPIPKELVDAIWNRDSGKCVYCGSVESLHLDHIIPFSKGGATCLENLQLLCEKCNLQKSNKIG